MANNEKTVELDDSNGDSHGNVKLRLKERSKEMAETKEMTKQILSKQAVKIAKQAEEDEILIDKVTYLVGVLSFGGFCFILGATVQVSEQTALTREFVSVLLQIVVIFYGGVIISCFVWFIYLSAPQM